jgi:hypothetical protein
MRIVLVDIDGDLGDEADAGVLTIDETGDVSRQAGLPGASCCRQVTGHGTDQVAAPTVLAPNLRDVVLGKHHILDWKGV